MADKPPLVTRRGGSPPPTHSPLTFEEIKESLLNNSRQQDAPPLTLEEIRESLRNNSRQQGAPPASGYGLTRTIIVASIVAAVIALALFGGLSIFEHKTEQRPGEAQESNDQPKLKTLIGRQDLVLVKNFFGVRVIISDSRIERSVTPGFVSFEAMSVFEPGKESTRIKGVRVDVGAAYVPNGYRSRPEHVSLLDENEAHDLDSALSYIESVEAQWAKTPPSHHTEIMFRSKDDFDVSLLRDEKGSDSLLVRSGSLDAMVDIPISQLTMVQIKLRSAIQTLDSN